MRYLALMSPRIIPLWPLPFAVAVILMVAVHLAWWISVQTGYIPFCVPYLEGCTSISRAARHGLGNHLFRLMVLPCALLVAANWWSAREWLRTPEGGAGERIFLVLGLVSAFALAVYATFLGTEGEAYRFLRRYGVTVFFGFGFLAQLGFMHLAVRQERLPRRLSIGMTSVCVVMLALGVVSVASTFVLSDAAHDRVENALEWQLGLLLVIWFALQARAWYSDGYAIRFTCRDPGNKG